MICDEAMKGFSIAGFAFREVPTCVRKAVPKSPVVMQQLPLVASGWKLHSSLFRKISLGFVEGRTAPDVPILMQVEFSLDLQALGCKSVFDFGVDQEEEGDSQVVWGDLGELIVFVRQKVLLFER